MQDYILALSTVGTAAAAWRLWQAQRNLKRLSINPSFGVLTQAASKAVIPTLPVPCDVLFFDIDQMKLFNTLFGWDRTSELVAGALAQVRAAYGRRRLTLWQELSGDEFGAHIRDKDGRTLALLVRAACIVQPLTPAERTALHVASGGAQKTLTATIALIEGARNIPNAIAQGKELIQAAKNAGRRGGIWTHEGEMQL